MADKLAINRSINGRVKALLDRQIEDDWPSSGRCHLLQVHQNGRIVSVAVTVAVSVNSGGLREVLSMTVEASEAETFWGDFLRSLARRVLRSAKLVISDAYDDIKLFVSRVFSAMWQNEPGIFAIDLDLRHAAVDLEIGASHKAGVVAGKE